MEVVAVAVAVAAAAGACKGGGSAGVKADERGAVVAAGGAAGAGRAASAEDGERVGRVEADARADVRAAAGATETAGSSPCEPVESRYPAAPRVVAIGDLHGDFAAAQRAFALAGATDEDGRWSGGELVVVQTGDVLDRGDGERAISDWLAKLAIEAEHAGGALHRLLGNHETMNARGDFRYVTPGGFAAFADVEPERVGAATVGDGGAGDDAPSRAAVTAAQRLPQAQRGRALAFSPGGAYARRLATLNAVVMIGDTVFTHGGVLPRWADYGIERLNQEIRCWLTGSTAMPPALSEADNPLWSRDYSAETADCEALDRALSALGARRMVVAHTPQKDGISSACDGKVWRIDTGMAAHYGGPTEVLELRGQNVTVLRAQ
ncbi:MAG: hypothetical protein Tsb0020_36960 [Haliangiales bacterium]